MANSHNIELTDWRLKELAKINIYSNQSEMVEKVKDALARHSRNKIEEHRQEIIDHKEAVERGLAEMAENVKGAEDEEEMNSFMAGL